MTTRELVSRCRAIHLIAGGFSVLVMKNDRRIIFYFPSLGVFYFPVYPSFLRENEKNHIDTCLWYTKSVDEHWQASRSDEQLILGREERQVKSGQAVALYRPLIDRHALRKLLDGLYNHGQGRWPVVERRERKPCTAVDRYRTGTTATRHRKEYHRASIVFHP